MILYNIYNTYTHICRAVPVPGAADAGARALQLHPLLEAGAVLLLQEPGAGVHALLLLPVQVG